MDKELPVKSGHEKRAFIRNTSKVNDFVHTSLQACTIHESREVLTVFIDRFKGNTQRSNNLRALPYLLDCLLAEIPLPDGSKKVQLFLEFQTAFEVFVAYQNDGKCADRIKTDKHVKKQFKELLCHSKYGLCIYIVHIDKGQCIVFHHDNVCLEAFFTKFLGEVDPNTVPLPGKEVVRKIFQCFDTEWDKKVLRVVLGMTHSRSELDELCIDSINCDRKAVFGYSGLYEDATKEAETIISNSLHKRLEKCSSGLKKKKSRQQRLIFGVKLKQMNFQKKFRIKF